MRSNRTGYWRIEAWNHLDCLWWSSFAQARGARVRSAQAICDFPSDRVYVSRVDADGTHRGMVAEWSSGRGWVCKDPRISDFLVG